MNADLRATARARRDEIRDNAVRPPLMEIIRLVHDSDALDAALSSLEQERDALKRALERIVESLTVMHRPNNNEAFVYSVARDALALVSVEEGTGHE